MQQFRKEGTTGEVSSVPYVAMMFNGILWCLYGFLISDNILIISNVSAAVMGLIYTVIFMRYKPAHFSMTPHMGVVAGLLSVIILIVLICDHHAAKTYIGLVGCTIGFVMFSGPLGAIKAIIRDKNTRSLPFSFTVASFICAATWSGYGLIMIRDPMIYVPNLAGLMASIVQLSLFVIYPKKGEVTEAAAFLAQLRSGVADVEEEKDALV